MENKTVLIAKSTDRSFREFHKKHTLKWTTLIQSVDINELMTQFPHYAWNRQPIIKGHIKDDYAVEFGRGVYDGQPCYYVVKNDIIYIFGDKPLTELRFVFVDQDNNYEKTQHSG